MLILLFVIFVGLFILGSIFIDECDHDVFRAFVQFCTVLGASVTIFVFVIVAYSYSSTRVVDEKIVMYTNENIKIEEQINTLVTEYLKYESETLLELKGDNSITLATLYPELKANELVQTQITTYVSNNEKIKELKELQIEASIYRWWLWFGK